MALDLLTTTGIANVMLFGGSRSGKTFMLIYAVIVRAMKAPNSRHAVIRKYFNSIKRSIALDTLPKVMRLCFPGMAYSLSKTDWVVTLPNGSEIWLLGLDDARRAEKVLGMEFATIYFNECSELSWSSVEVALTRLAQNIGLRLMAYFDCNPPGKSHWTYRLFVKLVDPKTRQDLSEPDGYGCLQMNPRDNADNLQEAYFKRLESLSAAQRKRFLDGNFADDNSGALWTIDAIDDARSEVPKELRRIVVAVDPSGAGSKDDTGSDEIGIVAVGRDHKGIDHCLEDASLRASPAGWARAAVGLSDKWKADCIIAEKNYGGAMVESTILSAKPSSRVKLITASRGKHVRAEPIAGRFEQGTAKFAGVFPDLEDQLCGFMPSGYIGDGSPDRADAYIWAMSELGGGSNYNLNNL